MKRQEIRLLALARSGDVQARCEVGRRYLSGSGGFPRHPASGIEHLTHPSVAELPAAVVALAEGLTLEDTVEAGLLGVLRKAAQSGSPLAQAKLGGWLLARHGEGGDGQAWLRKAAAQGHEASAKALQSWRSVMSAAGAGAALSALLGSLQADGLLDRHRVQLAAAEQALDAEDLPALGAPLAAALVESPAGDERAAQLLVLAVKSAEKRGQRLPHLDPALVEPVLEGAATQGDAQAAYALGRALCGLSVGSLPASTLCERQNLRKGVALLLRAADGGCDAAWVDLHRMHSDARSSVANPQLARFCLEKAAARGMPDAQRRLGALLLKSATALPETERAIAWLHQASLAGDGHATALLRTLVLPLPGAAEQAEAGIQAVAAHDPWLAARIRISRDFGLTKLEALSFDPPSGARPWGLVVGRNPFVSQIRLQAPRAVPALDARALERLRSAVAFFAEAAAEPSAVEGDLRRRSMNQRRLFARLGLDESLFFAKASTGVLDALRLGSKWAFRVRQPLQVALVE